MTIPLSDEQRIQIKHPSEVFKIFLPILEQDEAIDQDKEHFWVLGLLRNNVIHYVELVSLGTLTHSIVHPREVFRLAIQKGTSHIMLVHNHPSGSLEVSEADIDLTNRLVQVGHIVNIPVLDHVIITLQDYMSFRQAAMWSSIEQDTKYKPQYEIEMAALKRGIEEGEKRGAKKMALEMALEMKRRGIAMGVIAEVSGLSVSEIEKL